MKTLLSIDTNAKTKKGQAKGYLTGILYLAPSTESGVMNTCGYASAGCRAACLFTAGRGAFQNVRKARVDKTLLFHSAKADFMDQLVKDIQGLKKKADKLGMKPCVRLNGTSDISWESVPVGKASNIFEIFPDVPFYDYTKNIKKVIKLKENPLPNYSLTFSRSESNQAQAELALSLGVNVASVFRVIPPKSFGVPVINGDESDLRFLDPQGVIVGLKAKGKAKKDTSGFVL
jgi:hypothetical protein